VIDEYSGATPFDLWKIVPPSLLPVLPNVMWSRERLHRLALPVVELPIEELAWQLDLPWWRLGAKYFALGPSQVRHDPVGHASQWQRTLAADLGFPIHVLQRDRRIVLDGLHRLLKATVEGRSHIAAHVISRAVFVEHVIGHRA
jgi:hypothetical protein